MTDSTVTATGRLTDDPTVRDHNGITSVRFSIATNPRKRGAQGWEDMPAVYWNCEAWGPLAAQIGAVLRRGSLAVVQGQMRASEWEQDGEQRRTQFLRVTDAALHVHDRTFKPSDSPQGSAGGTQTGQQPPNNPAWGDYPSDGVSGAQIGGYNAAGWGQ